jgi:hypothetical protein
MTDLILKTTDDDCTTSDCYSVTKSVNYSVVTAVSPTGDDQVVNDNFLVAMSEDYSGHADLKDLSDHIETRLLLFQSSLDLFSDVRGPKPKSKQVEASRPIKTVTKAETIDETPKAKAQMKNKKSALKSCLRAEQETCSTDGDVTSELSLASGQGKSLDLSRSSTVNTFQSDPEDDVQADDRSGVDFSEVTVRTFACRLGDNPSASKYSTS